MSKSRAILNALKTGGKKSGKKSGSSRRKERKSKQRDKALKIFEGNTEVQGALKQALKKGSYSGSKLTNKEFGIFASLGATQEQLNKLADRVESSGGRLRMGSGVDIASYFPGSQEEDEDTGPQFPDYGAEIRDALSAADARYTDLLDQMKIDQAAMEERQRQAALINARRMRAAGRTPSLQIKGAGETPQTAGTQGFRRRKEQFRNKRFRGLAPIGPVAAANQLVNI